MSESAATDPAARIWLVTDVYPPDCGGSGWSTHALARALAARDHDVEVITIDPQSDGLAQRRFESVRVVEVGVHNARRNPLRRLGSNDYAHRVLESYLSGRLDAETDVRLVHAQHMHTGPPAVAAARAHGRASIQTLRDYWPVCLHGTSWWNGAECPGCSTPNLVGCMGEYWRWPSPLARVMVPWAKRRLAARRVGINRAHRVVTVSDWVRKRVAVEAPDAAYAVLPNIVDTAPTEASADAGETVDLPFAPPFLAAAGKLIKSKGFDIMLNDLARAECAWPLVIAGTGPQQAALERQADELGVRVAFTGWIAHPSLLSLVREARALLLPAAWNEPLSRLLLESMALATPVVAWRSGGNAEQITSGRDGWIIDDHHGLRAALDDLRDDARRDEVGAAGRLLATNRFSSEAVYPRLMEVYRQALAADPPSSGA